ncbi:MAG: hypothetical protein EB133_12800 [Betaproteobacteria bacterium]|nr:hypothetical protein [Betaproteobacteria bacterium]
MKSFASFEKQYKPKKRTPTADDPSEDILFETYGEDEQLVRKTNPKHVWTLLDGEHETIICAGMHFCNRINYLITETAWDDKNLCFRYVD